MKKSFVFFIITAIFLIITSCERGQKTTMETTVNQTTTSTKTVTTTKKTETTTKNDSPCNPEKNRKIVRSSKLEYVRLVCQLTGEDSINKTSSKYGFTGTDLGIPVFDGEKMLIFFGDTFGDNGLWRSNIVGFSTDFDLSDGLLFDTFLMQPYSFRVKAVIEGNHHANVADGVDGATTTDGREVTKIPTGGIHINGATYMFFMSVRYWGAAGQWLVNYNGVVKSTDGGNTWQLVPSLQWTEEEAPNFGQIFPVQDKDDPDIIYLYGIPGGRFGGMKLARVKKEHFENMNEYEYYNGLDDNYEPIWVKGKAGLSAIKNNSKSLIVPPRVGEVSVIYNEYLGKWLLTYMSETRSGIVFRTADNHWGPWSAEETILLNGDYVQVYGGFMHERYTEERGKKVYFIMSQFTPYEAYVFEMVFK